MAGRIVSGLEARGLSLHRRLEPTDLDLAPSSLTALVGPNGAGKTSLLHALARIGRPSGWVRIDGTSVDQAPPRARAELIGYVPASRELAWPLSVRDLVALTAPGMQADNVDVMLESLTLGVLAERRADRLSTGERSRVLIARALLPAPAVILLDEPFANLDPRWRLLIAERLRAEAHRGAAVLFTAHDLDLAIESAERLIVIDGGGIVADGEPAEVERSGAITRAFGVERRPGERWRQA